MEDTDDLGARGAEIIAEGKRWFTSRTVIFHLIGLLPPLFGLLAENLSLIQGSVDPRLYLVYIIAVHAIGLVLRCLTSKAITK